MRRITVFVIFGLTALFCAEGGYAQQTGSVGVTAPSTDSMKSRDVSDSVIAIAPFRINVPMHAVMLPGAGMTASEPWHPRLGLVLSGGGARGFAQIGVLRAFEEAGIRPDFIVGTSVGSIVGGLYASGYNARRL
ncbi:MAG: patatin-like phospholipase family protein, partial [Bacteroidota bacterium]